MNNDKDIVLSSDTLLNWDFKLDARGGDTKSYSPTAILLWARITPTVLSMVVITLGLEPSIETETVLMDKSVEVVITVTAASTSRIACDSLEDKIPETALRAPNILTHLLSPPTILLHFFCFVKFLFGAFHIDNHTK